MTDIMYIAQETWMPVEFINMLKLLNMSSYDPWSSPGNQYARGKTMNTHQIVAQNPM